VLIATQGEKVIRAVLLPDEIFSVLVGVEPEVHRPVCGSAQEKRFWLDGDAGQAARTCIDPADVVGAVGRTVFIRIRVRGDGETDFGRRSSCENVGSRTVKVKGRPGPIEVE